MPGRDHGLRARSDVPFHLIYARIQHTPARAHLLPDLLAALEPLPTEVISHWSQPPSPWGGYQACMQDLPDCTHLLIVQDDTVPVPGFVDALPQIARDVPVCLFLARLPRDTKPTADKAMKFGQRFVNLSWRSFMPIVAVLWPLPKLIEFREWVAENQHVKLIGAARSDDAMAGRWKLTTRQTVLACVPSIVEHPDREPSTIGRTVQWGKDKGRCAWFLAENATDYNWSD